jgi:hypothetical protein
MTLVYYNAIIDAIFVIEADEEAALGLCFALTVTGERAGWEYIGVL